MSPEIVVLFYFLNKHIVLQIVIAILLFSWSVVTIITQMTILPPDGQGILYYSLFNHWSSNPMGMKFVVVVLLASELLFINLFFKSNKFSDNKTLMPIVFFLLLVNAGKFLYCFSPVFLTILILTVILFFTTQDNSEKPVKNRTFAAGILVGFSSLVDPHAVWIILFLIISLLANRFSKFKEIMILICGFVFVYIYYFALAFLFDKIPLAISAIQNLQFFGLIHDFPSMKVLDMVLSGFLLLSVFFEMASLKLYFDSKLIVLRKRFMTTMFLFFVMLIALLFSNYGFRYGLLYLIVPVALIFSMLSILKNKRWLKDVLMVALLVLLWL